MVNGFRFAAIVFSLIACLTVAAQEFHFPHNVFPPQDEQIPGPPNDSGNTALCCANGPQRPVSEAEAKSWLGYLQAWRREHWVRMGYNGAQYERPELKWTQSSFIQTLMMSQERYFYDPKAGHYTVERYLDDLQRRYGGIDSVLIWPSYPNLGIDNRNQFDLIRDMPGGIEGVRAMIQTFHHHGVRVLFAYNPWDRGTRPEPSPDWGALAKLMAEVDADGVNADTMEVVPPAFREASDATGHPVAFEPENGGNSDTDFAIAWNNLTWGYWKYPFEPMISKNKWLETRHMVNVCDRWAHDKSDSIQAAFFNGVGYESLENIFGVWNMLEDRDAEALRRIGAIERTFADLLISPGWEPHAPVLEYGIFAGKFPGEGKVLWTLVNRNEFAVDGGQIRVGYQPGLRYFDVWHGKELKPEINGEMAILSFPMEGLGYGALLAAKELSPPEQELFVEMKAWAARPIHDYSRDWRPLPQHLVEITATKPASSPPAGMVKIPEGDFLFEVSGIEIEGGNSPGVDVQLPWEGAPQRSHRHWMHMRPFYLDRSLVTNADFRKFLDATHYHPADDHNFLKDWRSGSFPEGWANKPVTWVSLEDARAYASWAGKRLPHEWEWQHAAQGNDGRVYPWGNDWNPRSVPAPGNAQALPAPDDIGTHPKGDSPFGVGDLVGGVWQWTDEYEDEHTRSAILRGGSAFHPQGAMWYFPQAYKLSEHGKYLLMAPSLDRSGEIGFRCVVDAR